MSPVLPRRHLLQLLGWSRLLVLHSLSRRLDPCEAAENLHLVLRGRPVVGEVGRFVVGSLG